MLAWMGYAMLAAAALGGAAWLVDFAVAGRLGRRRALWAGVLVASAVGPIVLAVTRGLPTAAGAAEDVAAAPAPGRRREPIVSDRVLASAWLAMSAVCALSLVATQHRLRRRLRVYPPRVVAGERVLVSSDFGPAVVGVVRPQIVLPGWALALRDSDRRLVVAHEAEHRRARDPLLAAVALIVVAALPWNAALWWQLRRLRLAIEIDCDRRVVSRHARDPHAYGLLLLATHERASRVGPAMALPMAAMRSALGRRVEALVDGRPRSAVRRLSAVAAAVVLAAETVSVPAPRLSLARAAVVDAPAAAPLATSRTTSRTTARTPAPPDPREPSLHSEASDERPRGSGAAAPKRTRRARPRAALTAARLDASLTRVAAPVTPPAVALAGPVWSGDSVAPRLGPDSAEPVVVRRVRSASGATSYRILRSGATPNYRMVRSGAAPIRVTLLPIRDSLRPPPP